MMPSRRYFAPHFLAGSLALTYAWLISKTAYVTTGLQFVAPLAVILCVHLVWLVASGRLGSGFARVAVGRSLATAMAIAAASVLIAFAAPMPAAADQPLSDFLGGLFFWSICFAVVAFVVSVAAGLIYALALLFGWVTRKFMRKRPTDKDKLGDYGTVTLALLAIVAASLEGVPWGYSLASADYASVAYTVAAPPDRVWQAVEKATSPSFPLPPLLRAIPIPVQIVTDEGAALGARRVVHFSGREGQGDLTLQVTRRTDDEAVFTAVSDTSPIANWVHHRALNFHISPEDGGSRLTLTLNYDRELAPAWFFGGFMRMAAYLAVDVLARDTKKRAEAAAP